MQILPLVEFAGCGLVMSANAWLRYLYGAPLPARDWQSRHVLPFLSAIIVLGSIFMAISHPAPTNQPGTPPTDVGLALVALHSISAALVVWLFVEVGRYRTRSRNISRLGRHQSYPRIPSPKRRANRRKGTYRTR